MTNGYKTEFYKMITWCNHDKTPQIGLQTVLVGSFYAADKSLDSQVKTGLYARQEEPKCP